jgi:hypothetical protein
LIAFVVANLGWTAAEALDQMTFPLFAALQAEWKLRPPAHWLLAGFVGYRPETKPQYMTAEAARAMMHATGGKIPGIGPMGA